MATEPLSPLDLAFWRIESAAHPMHLGALAVFEAASPDAAARAAELLAARCAALPGLRRRIHDVLFPFGAAVWSPDADFDPARHVFLTGAGAADPAAADPHAAAGPLMARPLDRARPPWEAHVLAGPGPDSFAVLFKFHHALADGLGALALAAGLFDDALPPREPARRLPEQGDSPGSALRRLPGVLASRVQDLGQALEIGAAVARAGLPLGVPAALAAGPAAGTRSVTGLALDLDEVNLIRKAVGGTVNDVLIALVAGALRRWLAGRGDPEPLGAGPRALIPVSRRRPGAAPGAGNRLSGYLLRLPLAESDPLRRLAAVRTGMDRNKEAGPARGAGAVALLADHVHPLGHRLGGPLVAQAARLLYDILVTSVPLPGLTFTLGGSRVREVYPLAPLAPGQSLAVAVSTYKGTVHYGLVADAASVPDLAALAGALRAELDALVHEVT
ncbi:MULTISPECIES: wax ester/triacylglycerol synthase family O-acyltransferase [unclassified Streptomyces]|uniref:wax ester/triacylglycerol synthase family O-acyltransferase n=1 Tax=unclassified Streptomyces TaxID=2593676 RepID=UPI001BE5DC88|nr:MULTISPECIES: wax ester/triacylglycerol synthase family O-acyltransferase [unclassified Streptomyces]MBT2407790.1 wax ester/triacylglycerol synthase family O-acyltransferase [Streptomyces sp. ISL-21]MBT2608520.1 wax ester/triacylglycerol synthase family O-acyltransferase [Streptomyces sp. ISL-87]